MKIRFQNPVLILSLLLALLLTASCTIGNSGLNVSIQDGQVTATISIGQSVVDKLVSQAGANVQVENGNFVEEVRGVDFIAPDTIRIDGLFRLANGGTATGSIDFAIAAAEGTIKLAVAAVDADGLSLDAPAIRALNNEFAAEFAKDVRSQRGNGEGGITSITVTDDALTITISESLSN